MSAREAAQLAQGYWAGPSYTGQNQSAAQTLFGMQSEPARWRKNKSRRGGAVGRGNKGKTNTRNNFSRGNMRKNRKNRRNTRRNRRNRRN